MKLILLIDDNELIRDAFGEALRQQGYRVIEADSGTSGLALAREHLPDLILTDVHMPGGDGQELLRQIRLDPELCSKQVVLMTARPEMISPRKAMEGGADDFLVKPVRRDALIACMEARFSRGDIHWRVENQALSKLRGSMTSHLPHEFFTPLAGIIGLSDIIKSELPALSAAEVQDLNEGIRESAQRLHRTLRNYLLILENPDGKEMSMAPSSGLSSLKLTETFHAGVKAATERHGREDDLKISCDKGSFLVSEQDLALIVEELVDNALKFSRRGTPVTIQLGRDGSLAVSDSGRGMTLEEIAQIGAFHQFDRKKYEQQGLGLGLYLVQKLALRHGAQFSIRPNPEHGILASVKFLTQGE